MGWDGVGWDGTLDGMGWDFRRDGMGWDEAITRREASSDSNRLPTTPAWR